MASTDHPPPPSLRDQAADWVVRLHSDLCTEGDRQAFDHWLRQSATHRRVYEKILAQWKALGSFKAMAFPERAEALGFRPARTSRPTWRTLALRFTVVLLVVLGVTAPTPDGWLGAWNTYVTPKGARQTVTLAEGTRIELNTDTEVRVHLNRWRRSVELMRGEAFFTVTHDAARPFEVEAGAGRIHDLGTAFEVYRGSGLPIRARHLGARRILIEPAD